MIKTYKRTLSELSKEQLIYLIEQMSHSLLLIGEHCVEESKMHISSERAIDEIRKDIYRMPSLYDATSTGAFIDMKMGNISPEEYHRIIGLED